MRSSDVIGVHIENFVNVHVYRFRGWVVQLLQFVVQPHLDGEPLPDEAHLVRSVLGREEFLPPLLHLALLREVDPQSGATRRSLAVVHGLNAALHLRCAVVPWSVPWIVWSGLKKSTRRRRRPLRQRMITWWVVQKKRLRGLPKVSERRWL